MIFVLATGRGEHDADRLFRLSSYFVLHDAGRLTAYETLKQAEQDFVFSGMLHDDPYRSVRQSHSTRWLGDRAFLKGREA